MLLSLEPPAAFAVPAPRRARIALRPQNPWLERDRWRVELRADEPAARLPRLPGKRATAA
jgi:hypothetical protein